MLRQRRRQQQQLGEQNNGAELGLSRKLDDLALEQENQENVNFTMGITEGDPFGSNTSSFKLTSPSAKGKGTQTITDATPWSFSGSPRKTLPGNQDSPRAFGTERSNFKDAFVPRMNSPLSMKETKR